MPTVAPARHEPTAPVLVPFEGPHHVAGVFYSRLEDAELARQRFAERVRESATRRLRHATAVYDRVAELLKQVEGLGDEEAGAVLADLHVLLGLPRGERYILTPAGRAVVGLEPRPAAGRTA